MKIEFLYRQFTAVIVFAAFLAQTFSNTFVIADYYANTKAYAKYCENKSRPQMHCNGKCQMMKKLQQEQNKDQQNPERRGENKVQITVFTNLSFATITLFEKELSNTSYSNHQCGKEIKMAHSIFRPPAA